MMKRISIQERMRIVNKTRQITNLSMIEFYKWVENTYNCSIIKTTSVLDVKDKSLYLYIKAMKNIKIHDVEVTITIN